MRLGMPMFELQGRQKQSKRMAIFFTYTEKKSAVLFTTNIAARGLDFPLVNWILQLDCPENVEEYVEAVTEFCLNTGIRRQMEALRGGRCNHLLPMPCALSENRVK